MQQMKRHITPVDGQFIDEVESLKNIYEVFQRNENTYIAAKQHPEEPYPRAVRKDIVEMPYGKLRGKTASAQEIEESQLGDIISKETGLYKHSNSRPKLFQQGKEARKSFFSIK